MSRSTTALMIILVPMIGHAAIVVPQSRLGTVEEAVCPGYLDARVWSSNVPVRFSGSPHRKGQADVGAMLAMGYSYYGGLRPQRIALARQAFGVGMYNDNPRNMLALGYAITARHDGLQYVPCVRANRKARVKHGARHKVRKAHPHKAVR